MWAWIGGIAMGVGLGATFGLSTDNVGVGGALGIALGVTFALVFGAFETRRGGTGGS